MKKSHRFLFALLAILAYNSWIFLAFLNPALDPMRAFVSEYGAPSQPYSLLYRACDLITAAAVLALCYSGRKIRNLRLTRLYLIGFSFATVIDALFPMQCAQSLYPGGDNHIECVGLSTSVHEVASTFAGIFLAAAMFSWWWWARKRGHSGAYVALAYSAILIYLLGTIWCFFGAIGVPLSMLGLAQRLSLLASGVWYLLLCAKFEH